ncbi:hypothetical protein RI367_005847 [Sorochytrium milnesiophthora]
MTTDFKDRFSAHAEQYAKYRPTYPDALFEHVAAVAPARDVALDVGCGNGQAAFSLAKHFAKVMGTDASAKQIDIAQEKAKNMSNISFEACTAEDSGKQLADHSVDLITVAQAVHWFQLDAFYANVKRLLKPGKGVLAVWTYPIVAFPHDPHVHQTTQDFYHWLHKEQLWDPCIRQYFDSLYRDLPFPFDESDDISPRQWTQTARWSIDDLFGFFSSWSAVQTVRAQRNRDVVAEWEDRFRDAWRQDGGAQDTKDIQWHFHLRCGRNPL